MEKASYDMYVEALTQVSVLIMSSRIFTDREENSLSRKLRENLLEVFAGKAYNMNRKLRILGSGSLRERIVRFLVECQDSEGQIHMNLSREEMADYLNITRPSLSRELGKMQEEGILELDRRQILVKDQEKWSYICKVTYVTEESPGFCMMSVKTKNICRNIKIRER